MEEVQKTLEEILAKLAAVTTEVKATSEEVHGFRKQMEDYGTDLDGVKRRVQEANRQGRPSQLEVPLQNKGALTNHGAPLLGSVPDGLPNFRTAPSSPQNPEEQHGRQEQNGHQILSHADRHAPDQGDLRVRAPRHDFPKFSGEMPLLWIDQSTNYFEMFKIPPHQWVGIAMLYLEGHAALWYQAFKRRYTQVTWEIFTAAVIEEFDQNEYDGQMNKLMQLKQTGTVAEYRLAFEECMYHLISLDESLSSRWFVSKFVFGLRDDIRVAVRLQAPASITRAAALARIQEEEQEFNRPRQRPAAPTKHPSAPVPGSLTVTAARTDWPRKQGTDDFNRERQLRDFRRANNLCFKCGDKYNKEHQCKRSNQLLTIEVGEFGEVLSDEACLAMELLQETPIVGTCCHISQAALAGSEAPNSMRIRATVGDQVMILLIDSGSSHTFVTKNFAERAGCQLSPAPVVSVKIANGQLMQSHSQVLGLNWCYEGHIFSDNMRVLEIGGYDAILGMDWLDSCSPMYCHWAQKVLRFAHNGEVVTVKGMVSPDQQELQEVSVEQLQCLLDTNEVWAMAVLDNTKANPEAEIVTMAPDMQTLLSEFAEIFETPTSLPPRRALDHAISLETDAKPVNSRPYRYSPLQKDEIERQIAEMIKAGVVTPSMSPFASPVLLVKKKDGSWRFCVDYRKLNSMTIKNKFPLPVVDELLDELAGTKFFTKLDLRAGYHQIRMRPEDEDKTAFKTHHGHFQFRVMPFGLTNAPATFQCIMNSIFAPFLRKFVIVFLDDILIYSPSWSLHLTHLRMVFDILRESQFFIKISKCEFGQTSIHYLGHIISDVGVSTDPEKTVAMEQWPVPQNATELRGFLGLTGYYRKFVLNYGIISKPLTQLLTKKDFQWTDEAQSAFLALKKSMAQTTVLALPDFTLPFVIETDACDSGVGAVLMQQGHPIAYMSKALGIMNRKLSIYEKEFMVVIMAVDKWRQYLQRGPFLIMTDHKSLCNLSDQQLTSDLQRKAMAKLIGLQFQFKYKKGIENGAADSLSRVGHLLDMQTSSCRPDWVQEVLNSYSNDPDMQQMMQQLAIQSPDEKGFSLEQSLVKFKGRLVIGNNFALQTKLIAALHDSALGGHSGIQATYQRAKKLYYWAGMKLAVELFVRQCQVCQQAKHSNLKPAGLLQPLPPPKGAWQDISMDFIDGLPLSDGANVILVVVDRLTKYAHFIPLRHPYTAKSVAKAYVDNIVKLHGVPLSIISDRDRVFTSAFWRSLINAVGTKLHYSTAYHPQTDGQTERVNQCLEQYLRCAVQDEPKTWRRWLPMAEFWYNTSHHTSIDCSPYKALYRTEPNFGAMPNITVADDSAASETILDYQAQIELLREHLMRAQHRMKSQADKNRTDRQYMVGDQVLLKLQPYAQHSVVNRPCHKLSYKYFGPFTVLERIGAVAYKLQLPDAAQVHPVFHVSQLKPFIAKYTPVFSELPNTPDLRISASLPEAIIQRRMVRVGNAAGVQILVKWRGLPEEQATWEDYHVLRRRFPSASLWEEDRAQEGASVTPAPTVPVDNESLLRASVEVGPESEGGPPISD